MATITFYAKANIRHTATTSGLKAFARIQPPQAFLDQVNGTVRQIAAKLEIKWDGISWTDESTYFLSGKGNEKMQGDLGEGIASTLDVEVDNATERFTPDNTSSPVYSYLKPRTPIRVSIRCGGYTYRMFTGYIKNIHPDKKTKICSFECFDHQVFVYNKRANGIVYQDLRTDQLLSELAELADLEISLFNFDKGDQIVNYGYFEDRNVWPLMGEIAVAERGRVFFDRNGLLQFWSRSRLHNRQPSATITIDDWILDLDYSIAEHEIKNAVIVKAAPRYSAGIQVVWSNGNAEFLDPYSDTLIYLPPNTAQNAFLELEDPCTTFIIPVANTDYTANSTQDGSGDDMTSDIEITEFINYGNAVFLTVENKSPVTGAYLTLFQIRGNPAKVLKWIKVTAIDQPSVDAYGRQEIEIENNFITSEESASSIADEELERGREAINLFRIEIVGIPHLLTGDVVNLEHKAGSFREFMVYDMDWTFDDGGFKQKLTLVNPYTFPEVKRISAKAFIIHGDKVAHIQAKANITYAGLDQTYTIDDYYSYFGTNAQYYTGQIFTAGVTGTIDRIKLNMVRVGTPTDEAILELWTMTTGVNGEVPDTLIAEAQNRIDGATLDTAFNPNIVTFDFGNFVPIVAGTKYALVLRRSGAIDDSNYYVPYAGTTSLYAGGNMAYYNVGAGAWVNYSVLDLWFQIYVTPT